MQEGRASRERFRSVLISSGSAGRRAVSLWVGEVVWRTVQGSIFLPRQDAGDPVELAAFAESMTDVQLQMTFTEDGLHTIVTFVND